MSGTHTLTRRERMLQGRAERNARTRDIRLPDASADMGEDFIAKVRRFELGEKAVYFGAPESMVNRIAQRTKDYAGLLEKNNITVSSEGVSLNMSAFMIKMAQEPKFEAIVNTVCLVTFVDPPLVETKEELAGNPDAWHIDDLTLGDRIHVFYQLQTPEPKKPKEVAQEKLLDEFRDESADDVGRAGTGDDATAAE